MRKSLLLAGALLAVLAPIALAAPATAAAPESVAVVADPTRVSTALGDRFRLQTDVTNTGSTATGPVMAHLNVASISGDVYVDPEDWSTQRSQILAPLQPGERQALSWELQSVNAGDFAVYVVVLPHGERSVGQEPLVVSPMVRLDVATRSTLTAGGALPVTVVVPLLLGLAAAGARFRVRRRS